MNWLKALKAKAKALKRDIRVLYIAYKRKDIPWYVKAFMILVIGYALSPVDLVPDFIPILGYLDDLILIPLGVSIALRMIPHDILTECRDQAETVFRNGKPKNWVAGSIIILIWVFIISILLYKVICLF